MKIIRSAGKNLLAIANFIGLITAAILIHVPVPEVFNVLYFYTVLVFLIMLLYLSSSVREKVFNDVMGKTSGNIFNSPLYKTRKVMYYSSVMLVVISLASLRHFVLAGMWVCVLFICTNIYTTIEQLSTENE